MNVMELLDRELVLKSELKIKRLEIKKINQKLLPIRTAIEREVFDWRATEAVEKIEGDLNGSQ